MTPSGKAARIVLRRWRDVDARWYVDVRDEEIFRFTTERRDLTVADLLAAMRRSRSSADSLGFACGGSGIR